MRIIIDANAWISSLLKQRFQVRLEVFFDSEYHLIVSEELFDDMASAVRKPYLAEQIVRAEYDKLVARLRNVAELVDVHSVVEICRDPKDNFLLALAKDGNADYLITGDKDLLTLKEFEITKIVTLSEFETL
jgi:putative PIN family toxin of toxin-antitoxin system